MQDYTDIPLEFLLNKKLFERAQSVCIFASRIDCFFAEKYLRLLQPNSRLTLGYFNADEETRAYLENLSIRRLSLVHGAGRFVDIQSKILISEAGSKISIITASGLTQSDFDREKTLLWYSADEDECNAINLSTLKVIYGNPPKLGPSRPKA